jgi:hypothetical protein
VFCAARTACCQKCQAGECACYFSHLRRRTACFKKCQRPTTSHYDTERGEKVVSAHALPTPTCSPLIFLGCHQAVVVVVQSLVLSLLLKTSRKQEPAQYAAVLIRHLHTQHSHLTLFAFSSAIKCAVCSSLIKLFAALMLTLLCQLDGRPALLWHASCLISGPFILPVRMRAPFFPLPLVCVCVCLFVCSGGQLFDVAARANMLFTWLTSFETVWSYSKLISSLDLVIFKGFCSRKTIFSSIFVHVMTE